MKTESIQCRECGKELDMSAAAKGDRSVGSLVMTMQKSKYRTGFYCGKCEQLIAKEFEEI